MFENSLYRDDQVKVTVMGSKSYNQHLSGADRGGYTQVAPHVNTGIVLPPTKNSWK